MKAASGVIDGWESELRTDTSDSLLSEGGATVTGLDDFFSASGEGAAQTDAIDGWDSELTTDLFEVREGFLELFCIGLIALIGAFVQMMSGLVVKTLSEATLVGVIMRFKTGPTPKQHSVRVLIHPYKVNHPGRQSSASGGD